MDTKNKFQFTNEELNEFIGGVVPEGASGDVNNNNTVAYCVCYFYNAPSVINNNNSVDGCSCKCSNNKLDQ
jgi:hypothetical protein